MESFNVEIGGKTITIETGKIAKQANGSVLVRCEDTIVLVSACVSKKSSDFDFFPLTVDYREKTYAAGKFPGGFFKREGRPSDHEILVMRLIDRPLRPLFPDGFKNEVQVMAAVLSADCVIRPDILAMIGSSAALCISDIPFGEPLGSVRIGMINNEFIINPTTQELKESFLDLVFTGTEDAIAMVEGCAHLISEESLVEAMQLAHDSIQGIIQLQKDMIDKCGKEKLVFEVKTSEEGLINKVKKLFLHKVKEAFNIHDKKDRENFMDDALEDLLAQFEDSEDPDNTALLKEIKEIAYDIEKKETRSLMFSTKKRADGRAFDEIRPITCEVGVLPRTHGSALFTRGQTQALVSVTLGTGEDEQTVDKFDEVLSKSFMLHYNFPPFSVGEVGRLTGVGRREIGHGNLAERSLEALRPSKDKFPYTIRIVSDIMESNGSSSMASVCGGSLALMDAGVPMEGIVSGIAMGLIKDGDNYIVLSDIMGLEDHLGDMDFKVTGTSDAITAFQMDIKIKGVTFEILKNALAQAKDGRVYIYKKMKAAIASHRPEISAYAPRIESFKVPQDKIREIIGSGGKTIKGIIEETGVKIDIEDDGSVLIASSDLAALQKAKAIIEGIIEEPEVGKIYTGKVVKIMDFGAFVQFLPGKEGLVHISQLANERVNKVTDIVKEGDIVKVKLIEIDKMGRNNLSIKEAL